MNLVNIILNETVDPEHTKAIDFDNYNISRSSDDAMSNMHHIHNSHELLFVEQGSATYFIDGKPYPATAGNILVISAADHHKRVVHDSPFLRYGLTIKPSYFKSLMLENCFLQVFETPDIETYERYHRNINPEIFCLLINQLRLLKGESQNHEAHRSLMERSILAQIVLILYRAFGFKHQDTPLSAAHTRMLDIKDYIDLHYNEDLGLKLLADKFYLHPATISKYFHKYCGRSLNKYINLVRISEAAKLLESTNESITIIAQQCGYDSDITLSRQFKSLMDTSPAKYRKNMNERSDNKRK